MACCGVRATSMVTPTKRSSRSTKKNSTKFNNLSIVSQLDTPHLILTTSSTSFACPSLFTLEQAIEKIRATLMKSTRSSKTTEEMIMIDTIQRLGIDYYFQDEIGATLEKQFERWSGENDIYETSLRFRLLRQQGYNASADVFNRFKGRDGKFKQELGNNTKELMSLYEASHLSVQEEQILDEALRFSKDALNNKVKKLGEIEGKVVENTLRHSYHKSLARFMALDYVGDLNVFLNTIHNHNNNYYNENNNGGWCNIVEELAKLDFNMVQRIYRDELCQVSRWWKELNLAKELKFARDQPMKWYMCASAMLPDPWMAEHRIALTKPISLIYIIDDVFDVYATFEHLSLFAEAVHRWDSSSFEKMPDYMKICFNALNDVTNEISYTVYLKYGWNPTNSLRKAWATLCDAFLTEARWFTSGNSPKSKEYLSNGIVSSGVHIVLVHLFFLLGHGLNESNAHLLEDFPPIVSSPAAILRLWDDFGSAKDEEQDGNDGSYTDCYMKENAGSTLESAREHAVEMISDEWKRLNHDALISSSPFSATFKKASLNLARMVPLMYTYDGAHRLPLLDKHIKSLILSQF